jgi:hypothetical protein
MSRPVTLVIADSGPLISLAVAERLDLLVVWSQGLLERI